MANRNEIDFGPAAVPLDFPIPTVFPCNRVHIQALDHLTGKLHVVRNVLTECNAKDNNGNAYFLKEILSKKGKEKVWAAIVLQSVSNDNGIGIDVKWRSTEKIVVIKQICSWRKLSLAERGTFSKDMSALQYVGASSSHVQGSLETLNDGHSIYVVLPYCSSRSLQSISGPIRGSVYRRDEEEVRAWCRQLCKGLLHLQQKGIYHGNICLESLFFNENQQIVIGDVGRSKRIPFLDSLNPDITVGASEGTHRLFLSNQSPTPITDATCRAPETFQPSFDAFGADLFSTGVVLFQLLTGFAPFEQANNSDFRFKLISSGHLAELVVSSGANISVEACDLLQGMLWRNPDCRLTLADIMEHPWVEGKVLLSSTIPGPSASHQAYAGLKTERTLRSIRNKKIQRSLLVEWKRNSRNTMDLRSTETEEYGSCSAGPHTNVKTTGRYQELVEIIRSKPKEKLRAYNGGRFRSDTPHNAISARTA